MPALPFVACVIREDLPSDVARLDEVLASGAKASQAEVAGRLITDASCDLIDAYFGSLLTEIARRDPGAAGIEEARAVFEDVKGKLRHYLGWVTSFFSNERLAPVVTHYRGLMTSLPVGGAPRAHLAFPIARALGDETQRAFIALRAGEPNAAREGVEVLIRVIDAALEPLLLEPKRRMGFNFVVSRTLDGVISVTMAVVHHKLRKLGEHLPKKHFDVVADHLSQFVHV